MLTRPTTIVTTFFLFSSIAESPPSPDVADMLRVLKQRQRLKESHSLLPFFVNPFSPMLMCDWHLSGLEPDMWGEEIAFTEILTNPLNTSNAGDVKPCDSICVDVTAFETFVAEILPLLMDRIMLFTHRWFAPALHKSNLTDLIRSHPQVSHWFAQNPLYIEDGGYSAFPYGVHAANLPHFAEAFLAYHQGPKHKGTTIQLLHLGASHPSRQKLLAQILESGQGAMQVRQFYDKIASTRFLISPHGDRPDCYRHWESIGLGAVPISNIDESLYGPLFGDDNMMFVGDTDEMLDLLHSPSRLGSRYKPPQSERVLTSYWWRKVDAARQRCLMEGSP